MFQAAKKTAKSETAARRPKRMLPRRSPEAGFGAFIREFFLGAFA
jgi:hypothetical protein